MNDEERMLLKKIAKQVDQNNDILKGIRSQNRWASFFRVIYWIVILGSAYAAWYFVQPIIESFSQAIESFSNTSGQVKESFSGITDLLDVFNKIGK